MAELTTNRKTLLSDQETILARDIAPPKSIAEHENPEIQEIVFWDERNPKSLVNMVSDVVREELRKLPPSLLDAGIKASKKIPWEVDQIRLAFWDEYFIAVDTKKARMRMGAAYAKVCSREMFYQYIKNQDFLAHIVSPPQGYMLQLRSLLDIGLMRFNEILQLPLHTPNGNINTRVLTAIIQIVSIVDNRVKGAVPQALNISQRSMNMNVHTSVEEVKKSLEPPKTFHDINKELQDVQREISKIDSYATLKNVNLFESLPEGRSPVGSAGDTIEAEATRTEEA